ncbi:MAG: oligopeptidase A [Myxococcota bacterium]|jgi:oligopeptidase A
MNPLLDLQPDLDLGGLRPDHLRDAIPALLVQLSAAQHALAAAPTPNWAHVAALDAADGRLAAAMAVSGLVTWTTSAPELEAAYDSVLGDVEEARTELWADPAALAALGRTDRSGLSADQVRHLDQAMLRLKLGGADLDPADRRRLVTVDRAIAEECVAFSRAVRTDAGAWSLDLTEAQLAGLPDLVVEAAAANAAAAGVPGWRLALNAPTYRDVLRRAADPEVRRAVWTGWWRRGAAENAARIERIILLRRERAAILGFDGFTDLVTADRMAGDRRQVVDFLDTLASRARDAMQTEHAALVHAAGRPLRPWDMFQESERLQSALYQLDADTLRPWLPIDGVLTGVFELANRLFGVTVEERAAAGWAPEVRTFDLLDDSGTRLGRFHLDLHPRPGKRAGAWMSGLASGAWHDGPALAAVCANLTSPVPGRPTCITHREAVTVAHEVGHLLHYLLSEAPSYLLYGTAVPRDFVELPSQLLEEWLWTREGLDLVARHVDTGEPLPDVHLSRLRASRSFRAGTAMMRQVGLATLDVALHEDWEPDEAAVTFARGVDRDFGPVDLPEDYAQVCSFSHLFSHPIGYAGGYYVYKWAEVLSVDAFGAFEEAGVFDADTGRRFRETVLSRGNTVDVLEQFTAFRGRPPSLDPLLARLEPTPPPA